MVGVNGGVVGVNGGMVWVWEGGEVRVGGGGSREGAVGHLRTRDARAEGAAQAHAHIEGEA